MPFRQAMDHLAGDELLRDLTFECDAVITVLRHGLSSENLEGRSIPQIPIYRSAAAHPNRGTKVQRRCHARQHRRQLRSRLMVVPPARCHQRPAIASYGCPRGKAARLPAAPHVAFDFQHRQFFWV
jgi:hypothetical protein